MLLNVHACIYFSRIVSLKAGRDGKSAKMKSTVQNPRRCQDVRLRMYVLLCTCAIAYDVANVKWKGIGSSTYKAFEIDLLP